MHDGEAEAESTRFERSTDPVIEPGASRDTDDDDRAVETALEERVAALERAVTERDPARDESETPLDEQRAARRDDVADRLAELHERIDELDAAVQALRGYASGVRAVNEEVERRADLALATARTAASEGEKIGATAEPEVDPDPAGDAADQGTQLAEDRTVEAALPDQPAVAAAVPDATETDTDRAPSENDGRSGGIAPGVVDRLRDAL